MTATCLGVTDIGFGEVLGSRQAHIVSVLEWLSSIRIRGGL